MKRIKWWMIAVSTIMIGCTQQANDLKTKSLPNIIIINMDDLGYGDVSAYGAKAITTPNFDRLANEGIRFTNGYATSATCTPSRYALMTGVYPWKNKDAKILPGDAPLLINTNQLTLPAMLKKAGYMTGIVGKWHLGLGDGTTNWNEPIMPGPNQLGFDYAYIMAATQDRVPTVYIENGKVVNLDVNDPIQVSYAANFEGEPTALSHPHLQTMKWEHGHNNSVVNGVPRIGFMKGGEKAKWKDIDMADDFWKKASQFIQSNKKTPFFLYYAMQQPHVPRTPHPRFVGTTSMGPRGDVIMEADWCVGELLKLLENEKLLSNTLIVFTSDNGPVVNDGYQDESVEKLGNHQPNGPLRGGKYSLFEAGTRVPFMVYWKGQVKPLVSDAIVSHMDFLASFAALVGVTLTAESADSQNVLSALLGESSEGRTELVLEAQGKLALRQNEYVYIPPYKGPKVNEQVNIELGNSDDPQLYNVVADLGQTQNLATQMSERVQIMAKRLDSLRTQ